MLISLVVPAYNEGRQLIANLKQILAAAEPCGHDLELVVVDDGSRDDSAAQVAQLAIGDSRVRLVAFTRNFGKEAAVYAGLEHAQGEAVIVLDADLQHPPRLISQMVQEWEEGAQVVEAVKQKRNDASKLDAWLAKGFYSFYRKLSGFDIEGHSDFKLLDRQVVDLYLQLPERYRFFRGLVNWLGVDGAVIHFEVEPRAGEASRWNKVSLLRYALNNVTAFSALPLTIVTWLGCLTLAVGFALLVISLWQKITGSAEEGFTTVNVLLVLVGGSIMTSLGIIGHYVSKIYHEIKGRPIYIKKVPRRKRS
ncbi:glycosyltransferase family 2 protein [Pseudomonas sp. MAG002Y]|uniref:glycosyltransferase family 2 protein n=1 Tax=Pseudomonas sp. MAG002Y TaxID=2678690 RepID=UPI001C60DA12|nr:glycosyltransferase family 2 protein [Pseudomonas sp. MAG002Y]MBW5413093.1 glycosyltransferase [Pseudomonas sp. MAG002Y]